MKRVPTYRTALSVASEAPAFLAALVGVVLVWGGIFLAQIFDFPISGRLALEPLVELFPVVVGLLVVTVSLQVPEPAERGWSNVLLLTFSVAAVTHFMHSAFTHAATAHGADIAPQVRLWLGVCGRVAEVTAFVLMAVGVSFSGGAQRWLGISACVLIAVFASAMGPMPDWYGAGGAALDQGVNLALAALLALAGVMLWRRARPNAKPHAASADGALPVPLRLEADRLVAAAAFALALGECITGVWGNASTAGWALAHGFRVLGYICLCQAIYSHRVQVPYLRALNAEARLKDSETRLNRLGSNLPHGVLFQMMRDTKGLWHFVHMGDAVERLVGVRAEDVMRDPRTLLNLFSEAQRLALRDAAEASRQHMQVMEQVIPMRHADGRDLWMHVSASPRTLDGDRVIWDGILTDVTDFYQAIEALRRQERQMAATLGQVPGGVARFARDLTVLYVNDQQARWLGCEPSAVQGRRLHEVIPEDMLDRMMPHLHRAFAGETVVYQVRIEGESEAGVQYRQITMAPEPAAAGEVDAVLTFSYDMTPLKRIELELEQQKSRLGSVVNAMPDMVFLKDAEGVYLAVNPVFERFAGRPEAQVIGLTDYDLLPYQDAERVRKYDLRAMQAWQPLVYEETLTFLQDGYQGRFETIKTPIRDLQGRTTGVLGVCRDITERKRAEQEIERLAFYDALTGLPNRRLLLDRLQRTLAASQRSRQLGALLFIDLDNFKDLNDTLGHDMGDQLLAQVSQRLRSNVREVDTVARFGGDEFVVMLESLPTDLADAARQAEAVAEKLLANLNEPFALEGQQHYSTPSIGITVFGDQRLTVDELLKRADLAMYQAKAAGRNTQRFFDPQMQAAVNARSQLEADLRQGLTKGELYVHYQPVVDHQTRLTGVEALVRWRHPQRGLVSPGDFIALAEQTGLILPLGRMVLQTACEQLRRWSEDPRTAALNISVNVSARQFRQPGFVAEVLQALQAAGAQPNRLKLELTESLLLGDVEDTIDRMEQLKSQGVGFALDDFGTGYSSLSYLKRLPLDQVKIDQGFVRDVLTDPNDAAIVRTILALAASLDLHVVAEGVETTGQLAFLRLHGCEGFQGYLFGRPDAVEALHRDPQWGLPPLPAMPVRLHREGLA